MWCSELPTTWGDRILTGALRVNMNMLKRTQSTLQARVERLACVPWEGIEQGECGRLNHVACGSGGLRGVA